MKPYYADEYVTLYHGDCREVLAALPDGSIDLVLTDPPYNISEINGRDGTTVGKVKRADGSYREVVRNFGEWDHQFDPQWLTDEAERLLVHRGGFLCFTYDRLVSAYITSGLHHMRTLVWRKTNAQPQFPGNYQSACEWMVWQGKDAPPKFRGGGAVSNVYDFPIPSNKSHPCEKPLALVQRLVLLHSDVDDLVLDPFAGSGTTLRAAKDNGRRAVGVEVEERYCEIAARRLSQDVLDFGASA